MPVLKPIDRYTLGFKEGYKNGRFTTKQEFDAVALEKLGTTQSTAKDAINEINSTLAENLADSGVEADATEQTAELIAKIPDIPNYSAQWNALTDNGTYHAYLFYSNPNVVHAPHIDLSKSKNASNMFSGCTALKTVDLTAFAVPTSVNLMFYNCASLEYVPDLNFQMVVGDSQSIFMGCTKLKRIDGIVDLSNVAYTYVGGRIFKECRALEEVEVAGNLTNPAEICYNCISLKSIKIYSHGFGSRGSGNAFYNCTALTDVEFIMSPNRHIMETLSFQYSPLTAKSAKNVILSLLPNANFKTTITFSEYTWALLDAEGNASPNGNTWREYIMDIGWNT